MLAKRRLNKRPILSTRFPAAIEALERRVLMSASPIITHATADNRGQTILQFSNGDLDANTVNANTISVYTAGPSGNPANSDHVLQPSTVAYQSVTNVVTITANLPLNTPYEVVVRGSQIENIGDTAELDGEFNGADNPSGNGVQGGTYRFATSIAVNKVAVFSPGFLPSFEVALASKSEDNTVVSNFLKYANDGLWDGTLINRDVIEGQNGAQIGIFQAGEFYVTTPNGIGLIANLGNFTPNKNDFTNVAYTLSMATAGGIASNTFFFNAVANPSLDTSQSGGPYDAFGQVLFTSNPVIQDSFQSLYNGTIVDLSHRFVVTGNSQLAGLATEFTNVPTTGSTSVGMVAQSLSSATFQFTRIAIESAISAAITTPFIGASVRPAVAASNLQYAPGPAQSAAPAAVDGGGSLLDAPDSARLVL